MQIQMENVISRSEDRTGLQQVQSLRLALRNEGLRGVFGQLMSDIRMFFRNVGGELRDYVSSTPRIHMICLGVIFLTGLGLRLWFLWQPMGYDEAITVVSFASRSLLDVVSDHWTPNNHVFQTVLVHLSTLLFGLAPAAIRLPAFFAGLLLIPASFWLMRRMFDDNTALMAAGLTAVAPAMVEYSTQARGYTMLTLFFLVAFVLATYLKERSNLSVWGMYVGATILGFYTLPTMLYGFGIITLWMLFAASRTRRTALLSEAIVASVLAAMGTLFLYLPVIIRTGFDRFFANQWIAPLPLRTFLSRNTANVLFTANCWTGALNVPMATLVGISVIAALFFSWRMKKSALYVVPAILLWMIPVIAYQRVAPFPRVLNFLFPIMAGFAAYGLSTGFRKIQPTNFAWAANVWAAIVIMVCGYWGVSRLMIPNLPFPGAEGINQCAEGYFVDARAIVNDLGPVLGERGALVAYEYSGMAEPSRFYFVQSNRPYTLVHAYDRTKGLRQLEKYDQLFIVTQRALDDQGRLQSTPDEDDVLKALAAAKDDFERTFKRPQLISSYQVSDVYRLQRRSTSALSANSE
jgi:hypothetical protein